MPQAVPYNELIQPHFAFQQIPPCIYEAPRQEINSAGDLIFDFNFDQYQALSQQRRAAYEIEQQQQYQYPDQSRDRGSQSTSHSHDANPALDPPRRSWWRPRRRH